MACTEKRAFFFLHLHNIKDINCGNIRKFVTLSIIFWTTCRRVAEIEIFEKTYLIVIKDETCLKFKMNDSTLFLIGLYAQKLVASY